MVPLLAVLVVVIVFGVMGFRTGLVRRVIELLGLIVSIVLAARFASRATPNLIELTGFSEEPALVITFVVLVLAGLVLSRLLAWLVSRTVRLTILGWIDRWGGALAGAAIGWLLASVCLIALTQVPGGDALRISADRQPFLRAVMNSAPALYLRAHALWTEHGDLLWEEMMQRVRENSGQASSRQSQTRRDSDGIPG